MAEIHVGEHFEDKVDTQPAGCFQNLLKISRMRVIKYVVRAFAPDQFEAFLCAGCTKNGQAHRTRDLNGRDTNAATGAMNQYSFAGTASCTLI